MPRDEFEIAIVGAGIIGLAHAYLAAKAGRSVVVFERNPSATGASLRNFGMIWPIGQPHGALYCTALRSREIWVEVLREAGLPSWPTGSLHAAYREDEAAVGIEFAARSRALGYRYDWLTAKETLDRSSALNPEGLLGALWSPIELTVDPRLIISKLAAFLAERYGVSFQFNTAVHSVDVPVRSAGSKTWRAETVVLACGDDYQTLFPEIMAGFGLKRCKLQMLRTVAQPPGWQLGPALAFGLTFRHYPAFQICESLTPLAARISTETPELDRWGIHVMVSQSADGALTLGDSHQYDLGVDIFDRAEINRLIVDFARRRVRVPSLEIDQFWHGVYAKHPTEPYIRFSPAANIHGLVVTSGTGMTLSFGLAQETLIRNGVTS